MASDDHLRLAGVTEISWLLGVSRTRVGQLISLGTLPPAHQRLHMGSVWYVDDIVDWAESRNRTLHPEALARNPTEPECQ
jgi:hypothetical protein